MAWLYLGKGTGAAATNAASVNAVVPGAGETTGDLLVIIAFSRDGTVRSPDLPSTWSEAARYDGGATRGEIAVFYKIHTGTQGTVAVAFSGSGATGVSELVQMAAFRGNDSAQGTVLGDVGADSNWAAAQNIGPITAVTLTNAGQLLLVIAGRQQDMGTNGISAQVSTLTGDSQTWVEIEERGTTLGNDSGYVWNYAFTSGTPTITDKTFTNANTQTAAGGGMMVAFKPSTGAVLEAAPSAAATALSALTTAITAAASVAGSAVVAAALTTAITLGGAVIGSASTTADLVSPITLAASVTATATVDASITEIPTVGLEPEVEVEFPRRLRIWRWAITLTPQPDLQGEAVGTAEIGGDLETAITAAADVSGTATVAGELDAGITLASDSSASASVAGDLTTAITAAADVSGTATVAAAIFTASEASASVSASATVGADLTTAITAAASVSASATVSGDLIIVPQVGLEPEVEIEYPRARAYQRLFAAVLPSAQLSASVTGTATIAANLETQTLLEGSLTGVATTTAFLTNQITMAGAVSGSATVEADISTSIPLGASVTGTATASATTIDTGITFAADVSGIAATSPSLDAGSTAEAQVEGTATVSGDLETGITAEASVTGTASVAAALETAIPLAADVSGSASIAGDLVTGSSTSASVSGTASVIADLTTEVTLAADVTGTASVQADLFTVPVPAFAKFVIDKQDRPATSRLNAVSEAGFSTLQDVTLLTSGQERDGLCG